MITHHIGYAVKRIESSIADFDKLGYRIKSEPIYDSIRDAKICFMEKDGYVVELVSPMSATSVVSTIVKKYRNMPYHICYETDCFDQKLEELCNNGFAQITQVQPAPALSNRKVVFLIGASIGMIELLEK